MILGIQVPIFSFIMLMIIVFLGFVKLKRPVYEVLALSFIATIAINNRWDLFIPILKKTAGTQLLYVIIAFMLMSSLIEGTAQIDKMIDVIISLVGRIRGGAGWVALLISTFFSSLSNSGPGNVAATGVFTIPTMLKTGFPKELAANIELWASGLGPIIPPGGVNIPYAILLAFTGGTEVYTYNKVYLAAWGCGIWFFIHRAITLWAYIKKYDVQPIPEDRIKPFKDAWSECWPAALLPLLIIGFFVADAMFGNLIALRTTQKAYKAFSSLIMCFVPALVSIYVLIISRNFIRTKEGRDTVIDVFTNSWKRISTSGAVLFCGYALANIFSEIGLGEAIADIVTSINMPSFVLIVLSLLFFTLMCSVLPGTGVQNLFGLTWITIMSAAGFDPFICAAVSASISAALSSNVPPCATALYMAVGYADADVGKTIKMNWVFLAGHLVTAGLIISGLLPILGRF